MARSTWIAPRRSGVRVPLAPLPEHQCLSQARPFGARTGDARCRGKRAGRRRRSVRREREAAGVADWFRRPGVRDRTLLGALIRGRRLRACCAVWSFRRGRKAEQRGDDEAAIAISVRQPIAATRTRPFTSGSRASGLATKQVPGRGSSARRPAEMARPPSACMSLPTATAGASCGRAGRRRRPRLGTRRRRLTPGTRPRAPSRPTSPRPSAGTGGRSRAARSTRPTISPACCAGWAATARPSRSTAAASTSATESRR